MGDMEVGSLPYYLMMALLLLGGAFTLVCAVKDYDWFMEHRKAHFFVAIFGRRGARVIYGVLGAALFFGGLLFVVPLFA